MASCCELDYAFLFVLCSCCVVASSVTFSISLFFFLMIRRPPRSTRTDTLFRYTTLFRSVLLIGHNPGLEELVLLLVPDDARDTLRAEAAAKYPTATVAEIRFDDDWPSVTMASGTLTRFIRPRDLDPTLGPDQA